MHCFQVITRVAALVLCLLCPEVYGKALPAPQTASASSSAPTVTVANGTYQGLYSAQYDQDFFLGIPFAQPPVGQLRLNFPAPLNSSFKGIRKVIQYGPDCPTPSGLDDLGEPLSEDCLSINVIRPAGTTADASLPVAAWIYGGGYFNGGSRNPRYNLSFIVQDSVYKSTPILGVSFNYRVDGFGFLYSKEIRQAGVTNLGLRDQRLALEWIQENIAAFGGDPKKVTIWGESAGAGSVGAHTIAFGGRDDGLFRAAIAESGGPLMFSAQPPSQLQKVYDGVVKSTGCSKAKNSLSCLRQVPYQKFLKALNVTAWEGSFAPVVDGDFLVERSSLLLAAGKFTKVPLLIGANTAEGSMFGTMGVNNDSAFMDVLAGTGLDGQTAANLALLYPDIPAYGVPPTYVGRPNSTYGSQWQRAAAVGGDLVIHRGRRFSAEMWSRYDTPVYSYRFNVFPLGGVPNVIGTVHFQEVAFVFDNEAGDGYFPPHAPESPFAGQKVDYFTLAKLMSGMWISFVHSMDPNQHPTVVRGNGGPVPSWPVYADSGPLAAEGYGRNIVFDTNLTGLAEIEMDTYRGPGIAYLNSPAVQKQLGT